VTLIPLRCTLPLAQHNNTKIVDLDPLKNTPHFSATHRKFLSKSIQDYTCYRTNLKSIQDEKSYLTLFDQTQSLSNLNFSKSQSLEKLKSVFLYLIKVVVCYQILTNYSLHLKIGQSIKNWSVNS